MSLTLVTGGTRSGKSLHAERLALALNLPVTYVATADAPGMQERIAAHVARRPPEWTTTVAGSTFALPDTGCVLVDGLGVWIAGALHRGDDVEAGISELLQARAHVIVVAEDAGSGVLPADRLSRDWLDLLGTATQRLSGAADHHVHVIAGRPLTLHGTPPIPADEVALRHHGDRDVRPTDVDHAVNVLAGGPPEWLRQALADVDPSRYPDEDEATTAVARLHGRDPGEVVLTNGAAEALWLLGPALTPRLAAVVHPAFTETEAGLRAHAVPTTRVLRDPQTFALPAIPEPADVVVLGNPASPSGTLARAADVLALRREGRTVVVDEAFMSLVPGEAESLAHDDSVVVVRSLTKLLSIPGLRVGYALAPKPVAARLRAVRPPWSVNAHALAALVAAAAHPHDLAARAQAAAAERDDLAARLRTLDLRTWPAAANFCLVEVPDGTRVTAHLRAQGIAVRNAGTFPGLTTDHLRLTARSPEANAKLATAIRGALT